MQALSDILTPGRTLCRTPGVSKKRLFETIAGTISLHLDLEKRLARLQHKHYLTPEEDLEKKRIQKIKLAGKDRIMEILGRYR